MAQHSCAMSKHEQWTMKEHRRQVTKFHAALSAPPEKFDFFRRQISSFDHRRSAVVIFWRVIDDQAAVLKILSHGCARVRRRVLDVGPIDVMAGEFKIGLHPCGGVFWVAADKYPPHAHLFSAPR